MICPALLVVLSCLLLSQPSATFAALCTIAPPSKRFEKCIDLPTQEASLAWTFHPGNSTLQLCFFGTFISSSGWVGFGINPSSTTMIGTRALITFMDPISGQLILLPYVLTPDLKLQPSPLLSRPLDIPLLPSSAAFNGDQMVPPNNGAKIQIYASYKLPSNKTKIHVLWNRGFKVQRYSPEVHPTTPNDLSSATTIDVLSGFATSSSGDTDLFKIVHGIVNSISWGFILPVGALISRYLRHIQSFGSVWFYAHVGLQLSGLLLGTIGFGIGMWLGKQSPGIVYDLHKELAISALCLGASQTLALLFRPQTTNKFRKYWESYHHLAGYACVILGVVNVFQGFDVMGLNGSYSKLSYSLCLATLIGSCVAMEANSWVLFNRKFKEVKTTVSARPQDDLRS